jgi:hypothetical protein
MASKMDNENGQVVVMCVVGFLKEGLEYSGR